MGKSLIAGGDSEQSASEARGEVAIGVRQPYIFLAPKEGYERLDDTKYTSYCIDFHLRFHKDTDRGLRWIVDRSYILSEVWKKHINS